jgi:hypothetical protein
VFFPVNLNLKRRVPIIYPLGSSRARFLFIFHFSLHIRRREIEFQLGAKSLSFALIVGFNYELEEVAGVRGLAVSLPRQRSERMFHHHLCEPKTFTSAHSDPCHPPRFSLSP